MRHRWWWIVAGVVVAAAIAIVLLTGVRPAYDAYGWLTWGRQAWHVDLNTNAAPSWKPLTFLFTFPFALAGRGAVGLWMVTAAVGALAAPIPAARIAHRLASAEGGGGAPAIAAAVLAGIGVIGLRNYWHFEFISTADPLMVALCLGAIDCHLSGRPRAAFALLVLAALGRPEVWPFVLLYTAWRWSAAPRLRPELIGGLVVIVLLWFGIAAITSKSPFSAGETALTASVHPHSPVTVVIDNFLSFYELPLHLAALAAVALALVRRDRRQLALAAAVTAWVAMWVGLAAHGWEPDPRYMLEPAAVEVVLAATLLGGLPGLVGPRMTWRLAAVAPAILAIVALAPALPERIRLFGNGVILGRNWARQLDRLQSAVADEGGARSILGCGAAATTVAYQSIVAWDVGQNVADIFYQPRVAIRTGKPIVLILPYVDGWKVRAIHTPARLRSRCARLRMTTPYGYSREFTSFLERDHLRAPDGTACSLPATPACPVRRRTSFRG